MVLEECSPGLGRRFPATNHVFAHAGFAHIEAQLEQFAMDPRRAPERVLTAHRADQVTDLLGHRGPPGLTLSNFLSPEQAKALAMPIEDGRGLNEEERGPPVVPDLAQPSPQKSIGRGEFRPFDGTLQNTELVAERQDFQLQCHTTAEGGGKRREKRREESAERGSKKERQLPIYQSNRHLREAQ